MSSIVVFNNKETSECINTGIMYEEGDNTHNMYPTITVAGDKYKVKIRNLFAVHNCHVSLLKVVV